jgi:DNA-binding CsgD family transcriptional regulator/PAS domain-containing protein
MKSAHRVSRLIGQIYDAAVDSSQWQPMLCDLIEETAGRAGHLVMIERGGLRQNLISANFDPSEALKYNNYYYRLDPVAPLLETTPIGAIVTCRDAVSAEQKESEFYRDWAVPNEVADGVFVNIHRNGEDTCSLVIARPWLSRPFGTPRTMQLLELLVPHLQRAMAARRAIGSDKPNERAASALDKIPHGCVLLAADGKVLFANAIARDLTLAGDGLALSGCGLRARLTRDEALLQQLIYAARPARNGHLRSGGRGTMMRAAGRKPVVVQTVPLTSHWLGETFPGSTLVLIIDVERMARTCRRALQELYGLTPAEAALAVRIPGSQGLQKLANELGVSLSTVRTQLQRTFEKTGTHRQAELVQLLSELGLLGDGLLQGP